MSMIWPHALVLPIMLPLAGAVITALPGSRWGARLALLFSALTLATAVVVLHAVVVGGPHVYRIGGWPPPFGIVLVADLFSSTLGVTTAVIAVASALHAVATGEDLADRRLYHPLFLLLLAALGGVFLTGDLFNLYVFMEMVILSSFALVAMANRPVSAETAFKYAVLSALGSLVLLVSIALVYAAVGSLNIADIAQRARQGTPAPFWDIAAAMMLFAFLVKGAIFPFHFWQPDAHSAAPAPVSAMLSGILVKIGFYGVARMSTLLFPESPAMLTLAPLGAASALYGAFSALANSNLKRVLAYSTISNMGFILLALGWGGQSGIAAATIYAISHALIKASLFLSAGYLTERLHEQAISRLGGMARLTTSGTLAFGLGVLAIAGFPPLSGFLSKLALFRAGLAVGDSLHLTAAVVASALGIAYGARAFVLVFWGDTPSWVQEQWGQSANRSYGLLAPLFLAALYIAIGVWPEPVMTLAASTGAHLGQPDIYISAVLGGER